MKQTNAGQKREAEELLLDMPTLGLVAEKDEDFAPLRGIIKPVAGRPVNELGEDLRRDLRGAVHESLRLLLSAFFGACDARAGEIERKRAHVASGEELQGERRFCFLFLLLARDEDCSFWRRVVLAHLS